MRSDDIASFLGKGLSVKQPYAAAIVWAGKDVENRSQRTNYRGPVAIHSSALPCAGWEEELARRWRRTAGAARLPLERLIAHGLRRWQPPDDYEPLADGYLLGVGMLVDCVERSSSPWRGDSPFGWQLAGIIPIEPLRWKGQVASGIASSRTAPCRGPTSGCPRRSLRVRVRLPLPMHSLALRAGMFRTSPAGRGRFAQRTG